MSENIVIPPRSSSRREREPINLEKAKIKRQTGLGLSSKFFSAQRKISIQNLPSKNTEDKWENTEEDEAPNMKTFISPESSKLWADLDGEAVEFRNEYRPRARYLYFHFVCSMLRRAWNYKGKKEKVLTDQLGKKFWGTPRPYMRRTMLQALITEVGHEFEGISVGAETGKEGGQELDYTALAAAAQ
ncbi:MAG: hypothetical protein Q9187_007900 [Circinaria calcarea]